MTTNRQITTTRLLNFNRDLVFRAWTEPQHLKNWWGPKGFTNTFREFDLRAGGKWEFTMHGPDGTNYGNESQFVEIVKPERLVFNHISNPKFQVITTFEAQEEKTLLSFQMIFETEEICNNLRGIIVPSNEENFDRLEAELGRMV